MNNFSNRLREDIKEEILSKLEQLIDILENEGNKKTGMLLDVEVSKIKLFTSMLCYIDNTVFKGKKFKQLK